MTIRRKVKTIPLEEFIAAWVKGRSLREVQTLLNCDDTREAISSRATYLRKNGVPLGHMTGRFLHGGPPDFEKLKNLHTKLVEERDGGKIPLRFPMTDKF